MNNKINLIIISNDGKRLEKEVDSFYMNFSHSGRIGFLPNRLPLISDVNVSYMYYYENSKKNYVAVSNGFLSFKENTGLILVDTFEAIDEIDIDRAKDKIKEVTEKLNNEIKDEIERTVLEYSLEKAKNRVKLMELN